MSFEHPLWLLVIVPGLALAGLDLVRRWPATRARRIGAVAVRLSLVTLLALAAAEPRWAGHRHDTTVVFLIDRSGSVSDDALAGEWKKAEQLRSSLGEDEHAAVIQFDGQAEVAIAPGDPWQQPKQVRGSARDATDVAGAIRLGLGLIPPGAGGHLVLLGDGRSTSGDSGAAAAVAQARGIPISVVPSTAVTGDPAVAAIALDDEGRVKAGATLKGHIDVDAGGVHGTAALTIKVAGKDVQTTNVTLDGGHLDVPFTYALPPEVKPGVVSVEASLAVAGADRDAGNDNAASRLVVERPPHILILDGDRDGAVPLQKALEAEQMEVTVVQAADDGPMPELTDVDLVILTNAPVRAGMTPGVIDDEVGEKLVKWINDGGGMIVMGGPSALDGNYAQNRIADALPVEIEPMTPEIDQSATVIVVLDQSGSMGEMVGGQTKLALAAEGASAVVRLLRSFDHVGVESVEDIVHWVVPLRTIGGDTAALEAKIRAIPVGGDGIFVYTGLLAAQKALEGNTSPLKHVILFSDTTDAAEQVKGIDYGDGFSGWPSSRANSFDIAKQLKESGATLSVIGVGDGRDGAFNYATYNDDEDDTDFLRELAAVGGGRYYRTTDAKQLRGLFVQDARRLLDNHAREEDFHLKLTANLAALDGVDMTAAPPLHGFQELKARPAAQVVLVDDREGNPILTRWPYGLGEVAVWASDAGPRWAHDWLAWPGYARFWTQMARAALRRHEGDAAAIEADVKGDQATVRVVRHGVVGTPKARVVEDGKTRELPLRVVEPGVYEAPVPIGSEPTVELLDDQGKVAARRTLVRPASTELRDRGPDLAGLTKMAKATGGQVSPGSIRSSGRAVPTSTPLAAWLLLLAVLLVPVDASIRRIARQS
jgi:uncharacterized membrane protein